MFKAEGAEFNVFTPLYAATFGNIIVYQKEQNMYSPMVGEKRRNANQEQDFSKNCPRPSENIRLIWMKR